MPFFDRFSERWASTGVVVEPTEGQADAGFAHLGANPPTVEEFNALFQWSDDKDNWLFQQIAAVIQAAGATPTAGDTNALRDALRGLYGGGMQAFRTVGAASFVVPSGVTRIKARVWGGGGGGGGAANSNAAGAGGGGGGYAEGVYTVTPGATLAITTGAGGSGGVGSGSGTAGAASSVASLCSASGGGGGGGGNGAISTSNGSPGNGTNGALNYPGYGGGTGYAFGGGTFAAGFGGAAFGGSLTHPAVGTDGLGAHGPGCGGSGAATSSSSSGVTRTGGPGAPGLVVIEW